MPDETGVGAATSRRTGRITSLVVVALALALSATALAAHPRAGGHYRGTIPKIMVAGFSAPVSFTVAAGGAKLVRFTYGSLGCQGAGGFRPGVNPFTGQFLVPVARIRLASSGRFSVRHAKRVIKSTKGVPITTTTTTSVSGRFVTAKRATGTITLAQSFRPAHGAPFSCGPVALAFTATRH